MTALRATWRSAPVAVRTVCLSLLLSVVATGVVLGLAVDELGETTGLGAAVAVVAAVLACTAVISAGLAYALLRRSALGWLVLLLLSVPVCWQAAVDGGSVGVLSLGPSAAVLVALLWPSTLRWCWLEKRQQLPQHVPDLRRPD